VQREKEAEGEPMRAKNVNAPNLTRGKDDGLPHPRSSFHAPSTMCVMCG